MDTRQHFDRPTIELPPVSVVMPVYNGAPYVGEAIDSILAQSHRDFELIAIDDGSTDSTWPILQQYAARDPRVRVYTQANIDQPATLNRGLTLARHEWIAILDHDDVSEPERLERQLRTVLANPHIRVLGTAATEIDEAGRPIGIRGTGPTTIEELQEIRSRFGWLPIIHPSVLLHRPTVLALGGYDPAFGPAADTELWSRVADEHLVLALPEPLVRYRIHGASMSATRLFEQRELLRWIWTREIARRAGQPVPTLAEHRRAARGWLGLGQLNLWRGDWEQYFAGQIRLSWRAKRHGLAVAYLVGTTALSPRRTYRELRTALRRG